ncbi:MAG: T9SS type A sorting domain-containing protein [Bacteroidales bacterium]|nr:T9SS type A sorting domain-containing protein [Bacteroidales bacterium]
MKKTIILQLIFLFCFTQVNSQQTITVTNTNNDDAGSLREAIYIADFTTILDTILFNIPGAGPHTIQLVNCLPAITNPVFIDGFSQPGASPNTNGNGLGSNAVMQIIIDGSPTSGCDGLVIDAHNCVIQGLVINNFDNNGITVTGGNNIIRGNYIGTDVSGQDAEGNSLGIHIYETSDNTIGGILPEHRNIISGNHTGIYLAYSLNNTILGNFIGINADGNAELQNYDGIKLDHSDGNTIGGNARNVISGNSYHGIHIILGSNDNYIKGNYIGTDVTGASSVFNNRGIEINSSYYTFIGGTSTNDRNLISGNGSGIFIGGTSGTNNNTLIKGNYIGTKADGIGYLGNNKGIDISNSQNIIGGNEPGAGNVIAYNSNRGVQIYAGTGNLILSNQIFDCIPGIDLGYDSYTENDENDADEGPNNLQNYPEFSDVSIINDGSLEITYLISSSPDYSAYPLLVQFFTADDVYYEHPCGKNYIGNIFYYEDDWMIGQKTINLGNAAALGVTVNDKIVATATDAENNTSEFSYPSEFLDIKDHFGQMTGVNLFPNSPNPFSERTSIRYSLTSSQYVNLSVYNHLGQKITTLVNQRQTPDEYTIEFETGDLESGVYFYRLTNGKQSIARKMVVK